jgi:DNA-binding response OmpR family regulator
MTCTTIKLLHVEDDPVQRLFVAHHLSSISEYQFNVIPVETEDAAIASFDRGGIEFVILDYHLMAGNGMSCLEKLRRRDSIVPIIAISGLATSEIATELLRIGADDFISKKDLSGEVLARSVREALARTMACHRQTQKRELT